MVNCWLSALPTLAVQLHVAVPVFGSERLTRPIERFAVQRVALLASRLTKVTLAFRMSPALESKDGSPETAVISWTVTLSVTVAVLFVADPVEAYVTPVYVTRASSAFT